MFVHKWTPLLKESDLEMTSKVFQKIQEGLGDFKPSEMSMTDIVEI
jgi:hypothetical protein